MLERFRSILKDYIETDPDEINEETGLKTDLGVNSYEFMNIVMAIENEFGLEIPDRDIIGFQTVGDLLKYIETNAKNK